MHLWFRQNSSQGWATCPITENGAIRIISQPSFAAGPYTPKEAAHALRAVCKSEQHRFWQDGISLNDESLFLIENISTSKLVTDAYILGLAAKHGARLVSFDRSLPWHAIRNGTARLIESPLLQ
jgi:predicted nucleic acid-binding protein